MLRLENAALRAQNAALQERIRELEARLGQRGGESVCGAATDGSSIVPPAGSAAAGLPGGGSRGSTAE
jgi:hypothetical protein